MHNDLAIETFDTPEQHMTYLQFHEWMTGEIMQAMAIPPESRFGQSVFGRMKNKNEGKMLFVSTPKTQENRIMELWMQGGRQGC